MRKKEKDYIKAGREQLVDHLAGKKKNKYIIIKKDFILSK